MKESSVPIYPCFHTKSCISGELWHVVFGKIGMQIYKPSEFEGKSNMDGILNKNGILVDFPEIKGICFLPPFLSNNKEDIACFYMSENEDILELLSKISPIINNEFNENSYYYRIFER